MNFGFSGIEWMGRLEVLCWIGIVRFSSFCSAFVGDFRCLNFTSVPQSQCTMSLMNETSADLSMACSPDIWELKMFLWTSADMIAWNDVLLEMMQIPGVTVEPSVVS